MTRRNIWIIFAFFLFAGGTNSAEAGFLCASLTADSFPADLMEGLPKASEKSAPAKSPPAENDPELDLPISDLAETAGVGIPNSRVTNSSASGPAAAHFLSRLPQTTPELCLELVHQANSDLPPPFADRLFRPPRDV